MRIAQAACCCGYVIGVPVGFLIALTPGYDWWTYVMGGVAIALAPYVVERFYA